MQTAISSVSHVLALLECMHRGRVTALANASAQVYMASWCLQLLLLMVHCDIQRRLLFSALWMQLAPQTAGGRVAVSAAELLALHALPGGRLLLLG